MRLSCKSAANNRVSMVLNHADVVSTRGQASAIHKSCQVLPNCDFPIFLVILVVWVFR